jgi:hypothetical protein
MWDYLLVTSALPGNVGEPENRVSNILQGSWSAQICSSLRLVRM